MSGLPCGRDRHLTRIAPRPAPPATPQQQEAPISGTAPSPCSSQHLLRQQLQQGPAYAMGHGFPLGGPRQRSSRESPGQKAEQQRLRKNFKQRERRSKQAQEKMKQRLAEKEALADIKARILSAADPLCEPAALDVLLDMHRRGYLVDGTASFGTGGTRGFANGLFCGLLTQIDAPDSAGDPNAGRRILRRRKDDSESFWSLGSRIEFSPTCLKACNSAGFPIVFEGDMCPGSVMAKASEEALREGWQKVGYIGGASGTSMFEVSEKLVAGWREGHVGYDMLSEAFGSRSTWTIPGFEETAMEDGVCAKTIKSKEALLLVQKTTMGSMLFPGRPVDGKGGLAEGGSLTEVRCINGRSWAGSNITSFAMKAGGVTTTHIDSQLVLDELELLPAAGLMHSVNRGECGPAKRAIICCRLDMDTVVSILGLDLKKPSATQYSGRLTSLEDLAAELKESNVRFVVAEFPPNCSYFIPKGCAHSFVTLRLVESAAWHVTVRA